jgi:hypothetical protein
VQEVPPPGRQEVEGVLEPPRQDQVEHPGHAEDHVDGQEPQQREDAVVLEHRGQRGALGVVAGAPGWLLLGPLAATGRVPVASGRERRHEYTEAGQARPPAEVQIVVVAGEALVEGSRPLPRLARDQHDGGGHEQDLEHPVVLALVQLALLQGGVRVAEPVGRAPHLPEHPRLVPVDDLGADDAHAFHGLDAFGGLEEAFDGIGRERRVVVHQQEVVGGLGGRELGRGGKRPRDARFSPRATTRASPSACRRSSSVPSEEPLSTATTPRRG